ncbi:MAG TPA: fluoride efflux transporter CrcB [Flavobacterium sp.]|nr:fluoride efflux transporter CrcB [Flavobacterium sp.]
MFRTILLVAIGGAIGSVLRYLTSLFVQKFYASSFPLATFLTNILGCFLIGLIVGLLDKNQLADSNLKWFLITGFCGGYTTFSAFGFENVSLLQNNHSGLALLYIGASIFIGLAAVWAGLSLAK